MEKDKQRILLNPDTPKFNQVKDKIKNGNLDHEIAWKNVQPLLEVCVEDYPEKYISHLKLVRAIFGFRRAAFLKQIEDKQASNQIKELFSSLPDDEQDKIGELAACIRDLFSIPESYKVRKNFR